MDRGRIPDGYDFAGQRLEPPLPGGNLLSCLTCNLAFRSPRPSKDALDALYRSASGSHWSVALQHRPDVALMKSIVQELLPKGGRVLDVGCFDGLFLSTLGAGYQRFGIEINGEAASVATARGITIVGRDFSEALLGGVEPYDAVVSLDTIEHTLEPLAFLRDLTGLVAKGGFVIVSTGNSDASAWRWMGGRYWYCLIPEHQTFINSRWAKWASGQVGMEVKSVSLFSHSVRNLHCWMRQSAQNALYRYTPFVAEAIRNLKQRNVPMGKRSVPVGTPPYWDQSRDHMLVAFQKM